MANAPMPGWSPIWLACKCGHEWDDWQPCHCPIDTWVAHVKTYRCPQCGKRGRNILLRQKPIGTALAVDVPAGASAHR